MTIKFPIFLSGEFLKNITLLHLIVILLGLLIAIMLIKDILTYFVNIYLYKKKQGYIQKKLKEIYISTIKNSKGEEKLKKALLFLDLINEEAVDLDQVSKALNLSPESSHQLKSFRKNQKIKPEALEEITTKLEILLLTKN